MFRGLSGTELTAAIVLSLVPGVPAAGIVCMSAGSLLWALPVVVLSAFATVLLAGTALRSLKRNRPPHWYLQRLALWCGPRTGLICQHGAWRIDR